MKYKKQHIVDTLIAYGRTKFIRKEIILVFYIVAYHSGYLDKYPELGFIRIKKVRRKHVFKRKDGTNFTYLGSEVKLIHPSGDFVSNLRFRDQQDFMDFIRDKSLHSNFQHDYSVFCELLGIKT